jgi:lipopolysaccharide transport system ATP-binding protein
MDNSTSHSAENHLGGSDSVIVRAHNLGKCFRIFNNPKDRLKQAIAKHRRQYFREFWALRHVDFELKRGETLGIIGRNGSGKSTLLQLLCGTLTPSEGESRTTGRLAALLELGSGFNPDFTGIENIYLYASLLGLKKHEIDARLDGILGFADIGEFTQQPVKTYSSGMAVRLAFAVVANVDADILIVDEALSVGDVFFVQKCMRFINSFKESNTLILVTHDTQSVLSVCTHGLVLSEGKMIAGKTTSKQAIDAYTNDYYRSSIGASGNISTNRTATERGNEALDTQKSSRQPSVVHGATESDGSVYTTALERVLDQMVLAGYSIHTKIADIQDTDEFGNNECRIIRISVCNLDTNKSALVAEGEKIAIEIAIECLEDISFPIVGFAIRNNNGLAVIGENTFQTGYGERSNYAKGELIRARFTFTLPRLAPGKYSVHAAVARGTQQDHVQMHYFHDVCAFEVVSLKASSALICPSDMNSEILVTSDGPS